MTSRLGYFKGVDIASASAITTGSNGTYHDITGTTPINSIASKRAGSVVLFRVISGGLTIVHLAGTLNMLGKVDFTSKAGDIIAFVSEGAGEWQELWRNAEDGTLKIGRSATLTMPTGANWFTISQARTNLTGGVFTGAATLTMPTGGNWFTISASRCTFCCQCNC